VSRDVWEEEEYEEKKEVKPKTVKSNATQPAAAFTKKNQSEKSSNQPSLM